MIFFISLPLFPCLFGHSLASIHRRCNEALYNSLWNGHMVFLNHRFTLVINRFRVILLQTICTYRQNSKSTAMISYLTHKSLSVTEKRVKEWEKKRSFLIVQTSNHWIQIWQNVEIKSIMQWKKKLLKSDVCKSTVIYFIRIQSKHGSTPNCHWIFLSAY